MVAGDEDEANDDGAAAGMTIGVPQAQDRERAWPRQR
jgi:hypothetical protein